MDIPGKAARSVDGKEEKEKLCTAFHEFPFAGSLLLIYLFLKPRNSASFEDYFNKKKMY